MTAIEYMERQVVSNKLNHDREFARGAPEEVLENIRKKIGYYEEAVEALKRGERVGMKPKLCANAVHSRFFGCPVCGEEVGGYVITGCGEDDWSTHQDKFCKSCGQEISWRGTKWSDLYKSRGEDDYGI